MTAAETDLAYELASRSRLQLIEIDALDIGDDFRLDDDVEQLAELTASIAEHGVLQPLLVRQRASGYEVVAGRRRLSAARTAGLERVPCLVRPLTDDEATDAALAENLHRRNLSPIEEALAYRHLRDQGVRAADIAVRVGRSGSHVYMLLKLLELPEPLQAKIHAGKVSYASALDHYRKPTGKQQGGAHKSRAETEAQYLGAGRGMSDDAYTLVNYWRKRHDRLLAGLHAIRREKLPDLGNVPHVDRFGVILDHFRGMLNRLIAVDTDPFPDESATDSKQ